MGMADYDYEEAVKYRYEYWEREGWLKSCLETLEKIGSDNWETIDAVAMVVAGMDDRDRAEIAKARKLGRDEELTPKEAIEILEKGGTVWLQDWSETNYGDEENPSYDYPIEDPDELRDLIDEGELVGGDGFEPVVILADRSENLHAGAISRLYYEGVRKVIQQRLDYTREEIEDAEKVIEDY